jgi:hypothetical protein
MASLRMPIVDNCSVSACAYNEEGGCHARAITVGDGRHPGCDTFFITEGDHPDADLVAGVGACKVTGCKYNRALECEAETIEVGYVNHGPRCQTHQHA